MSARPSVTMTRKADYAFALVKVPELSEDAQVRLIVGAIKDAATTIEQLDGELSQVRAALAEMTTERDEVVERLQAANAAIVRLANAGAKKRAKGK